MADNRQRNQREQKQEREAKSGLEHANITEQCQTIAQGKHGEYRAGDCDCGASGDTVCAGEKQDPGGEPNQNERQAD